MKFTLVRDERDRLRAEVERLKVERKSDIDRMCADVKRLREETEKLRVEVVGRAQRLEAALREARGVLERYHFGICEDDPDGWNNDVQEMIARIGAELGEESKG